MKRTLSPPSWLTVVLAAMAPACASPGPSASVDAPGLDAAVDTAAPDSPADSPPVDTDALGPWTVQITAASRSLVADGRSETTLECVVTDPDARTPPDGTLLPFTSDLGHVQEVTATEGGRATVRLRAGTWPGTASLAVAGMYAVGDTTLDFVPGTPASVQLHLHGSVSEGDGSMTGHIGDAEALGIDALWWTDHDFSYYADHAYEVTGFDFESAALAHEIPGWPGGTVHEVELLHVPDATLGELTSEVTPEAASTGGFGWRVGGTGGEGETPAQATWTLNVAPRIHFKSLLTPVTLNVSFRPRVDAATAELWVVVPVSARGVNDTLVPEGTRAIHLYYGDADYTSSSDDRNLYVRMRGDVGEWTHYSVELSGLVASRWPSLQNDVHAEFVTVTVRAWDGALASFDVDDLTWQQDGVGEDLRDAQRAFLAAQPTSTTQLMGYELSFLDEGHFNVFGDSVPFLPYAESDAWDGASAVEFVHAAGGLVSYNHMFGVKGGMAEADERAALVAEKAAMLLENAAWGVDLLEVGYRQRQGDVDDFLAVWDTLSMAGVYVTGEGASDVHDDLDWVNMPNNFVTWATVAAVDEEDMEHALRRGAAFFGDPSRFEGGDVDVSVTVPEARATMGQVAGGLSQLTEVVFAADPLQAGWVVRAVEDGEVAETWTVSSTGAFSASRWVDPVGDAVVRFEVLSSDADPVLYTNPVWLYEVLPDGVPEDRLPDP